MHEVFTENITEYIAHAQTVCTRPLLGGEGGEGPGDEAKYLPSVRVLFP